MTPKLRFPEFSGEWGVKQVRDIFKVTRGQVLAVPETRLNRDDEYRYPVYSSQTKNNGLMGYYSKVLFKNAITWTTDGANAGDVKYREGEFYCTNVCGVLLSDEGYANAAVAEILNSVTRGYVSYVGNPKLMNDVMASIKIALPNTTELEKIAEFLTVVDERVAAIDEKVELLQQYKKGVMQKIFTQKLRFKDENGTNYPDWQEKKLGKLEDEKQIKLGRGEVISKEDIANHPGNYPIYSSSVRNDGLFGYYGKYMFDEELITWSVDGGGHFFYRPAGRFSVTNVSGWLRVLDAKLSCKFLSLQLQRLHERLIFDYQTKAHPSVIRQLYSVQLPCLEEQQKIADFLTSLDDKIRLEKAKLEQAKSFKKSLLQRMFV